MEKIKQEEFFRVFMDHLRGLVKESPYIIFIYISPILLIITLIWWHEYIKFFFIFFLYSIFGIIWRHFIKDIRGRIKESYPIEIFTKINLWLTGIYQIVNILVVITLVVLMLKLYIIK